MNEQLLGTMTMLVIVGIICAVVRQFFHWISNAKPTPDPWGEEVERELQSPDARELCHRCLTPQPDRGWFCENCGASIGPYNNYMPYVHVFSQGEVLRAGTHDHLRPSFLIIMGYVLFSFAAFAICAPIYLFFVIRHLSRQPKPSSDKIVGQTQNFGEL